MSFGEGKGDFTEGTKEVEILFTPNELYFTLTNSITQNRKKQFLLYETTQSQNRHAEALFKSKNAA